jgi:hypothetical protein
MIGRLIGGALGAVAAGRGRSHPIAGAVIGAGTMFAARRLFPARYAALAATAGAAYLTKKWAERQEAERQAKEISGAITGPNSPTAPVVQPAEDVAADQAALQHKL